MYHPYFLFLSEEKSENKTSNIHTNMPYMTAHNKNSQMVKYKYYQLWIIAYIGTCLHTCIFTKGFVRSTTWNSFCTAGIQSIVWISYEGVCMYQCHPQTRSPAEVLYRWHTFACDLAKGLLRTRDMECDFQLVFRGFIHGTVKERMC